MFSLTLPNISYILREYYPMKIHENNNPLNVLPCDILELSEITQFDFPSAPVDSGMSISDTMYRYPKVVSVSVYINNRDYNLFNAYLESLQISTGFTIVGLDYQKYDNMHYTDKNESQSPNIAGAYVINLTFKEIIKINAFSEGALIPKPAKASNTPNSNQGQKAPQERPQTALYKNFYS